MSEMNSNTPGSPPRVDETKNSSKNKKDVTKVKTNAPELNLTKQTGHHVNAFAFFCVFSSTCFLCVNTHIRHFCIYHDF